VRIDRRRRAVPVRFAERLRIGKREFRRADARRCHRGDGDRGVAAVKRDMTFAFAAGKRYDAQFNSNPASCRCVPEQAWLA